MATWTDFRCLITGGSRGIGFAIADELTRLGAQVVIVGRDPARVNAAARLLSDGRLGHATGLAVSIDGRETTAERLVEQALTTLGGLDGLVNAAGGATVGHALTVPWDVWQRDVATKFWGYFALMRAAAPVLQSPGGVMVNLVGVAGKDPNPRLAPGTVINGALRGLIKILADDLAPRGIRVLAVNPGATETDLLHEMAQGYARLNSTTVEEALKGLKASGPLGRLPTAVDIAKAVVFLMSDDAALISGTSIDIDGGVHRGPA
ncbi:SDR family NAD(P)-dependent oxidoreductase [Sulfobacillus harzensis]|uniref:SDR family NAD(P)-dependent oxidoreductase n=1 Tax=Sulfobacillus harzensis TaxID=2729629 RepID=UPI001FABF0C6|nr:SDR family oxidoreductase [Sulfobacillus harzensis]